MEGYGVAYGAITVINAFATGIGAAIGVDLKVETFIKKNIETKVKSYFLGAPINVDMSLIYEIIGFFRSRYSLEDELHIEIHSEIPPERGLKSSSAVANSLITSLFDYLGIQAGEDEVLNINVYTSLQSGVSITGALDDAAASLLGGIAITDNIGWRILKHEPIDQHNVLIAYPSTRVKTSAFRDMDFQPIRNLVRIAIDKLFEGSWREAMTLNGIIYASFLGYDVRPIYLALKQGAEAVSLTGKGPAYAAISHNIDYIRVLWEETMECKFIVTKTR